MRIAIIALVIVLSNATTAFAGNPDRWRIEGWTKTDFSMTSIAWSEILSGGPPKDGIPSIDDPAFVPAKEATELSAEEPVIALEINGDARAYPFRTLIWHEIVNDTVGGEPVAVTFCPLCNSAVVFSRTIAGNVTEFGTTGKLRNSDLVMYDRQTESWWQQFTGQAIVGALNGTRLERLPALLISVSAFQQRFPNGKMLVPNNTGFRPYGRNPYVGYDSSRRPFLYRGAMPEGIEPMARVVVVDRNGADPLIVTLDHIRQTAPTDIDGLGFVWTAGRRSAVDTRDIAEGRDMGMVEVTGGGGEAVPYDVTFAFVAHAFHPELPIIGKE